MSKRRKYSGEFKREAVTMANQPGVTKAQIGQELGINPNMLTRWHRELNDSGSKAFGGQGKARDEEMAALKRELGRVKKERDFLPRHIVRRTTSRSRSGPRTFSTVGRPGARPLLPITKRSVVGCVIRLYHDRSFDFEIKSSPTSVLIKEAAGVEKGSGTPNTEKVGNITAEQVRAIAQEKLVDLNADDIEAAAKIIAGTARSMGITVEEG